jgi:transglutaminase/protease-like cytokinesis protein 3
MLGAVERDQQPRRWNGARPAAVVSRPLRNSPSKAAGEVPSSIWRMWLSLGIAAIPNRVWQFDRPCPSASVRWCPRNDGLCMKNTENAAKPMSAMV